MGLYDHIIVTVMSFLTTPGTIFSLYTPIAGPDLITKTANEVVKDFKEECIKRNHIQCLFLLNDLPPIRVAEEIHYGEDTVGLYFYSTNEIIIKNSLEPELDIKLTVLHELGHMLGLGHIPKTIMNESNFEGQGYEASLNEIFLLDAKSN
jgi:Zn-dependent peptidase ImmA (M78 family)